MNRQLWISLLFFIIYSCAQNDLNNKASMETSQNWTHYVRIAGHGLDLKNIDRIIAGVKETHVYGIEVDNSLTGYYESFLDPTEKLEAIKAIAKRASEINNHAFIYNEGLETITSDSEQKEHTFYKDHPDWVQRDFENRPAVFGGGDAFWIDEGDEDVWISPFALQWRNMYMERIRQIAETGIDGIFIDIPYWMTHFDGWEDTWASFDTYTVAAFKQKTGLDAKTDFKLGDFSDPNFRKWVDFRIEALTDFMADVSKNAKSVNPEIKVIAEIYPGIDESVVRVGADVYEMYQVVDVVAHEFSGGGGNAASKNPLDWFSRMAGMYTFRAFAEGKASWMLSYSWDEDNKVSASEAMKNLALSNVMAGTNCWDARGHVMSGSNDMETRKEIFKWIEENEDVFYKPRKSIQPIGIYFSPKSRNYFPKGYINSYLGMMYLMLQHHLEFEIVTPRTLKDFNGKILILSDVRCISEEEVDQIEAYLKTGNALIATDQSGKYDETGMKNKINRLKTMMKETFGNNNATSLREDQFHYYQIGPGIKYTEYCRRSFNHYAWSGDYTKSEFWKRKDELLSNLKTKFKYRPVIRIEASPYISTQIAQVDSKPHVFLANFRGLKRDEVATQIPEENVKISFPAESGTKIFFLPFLGEKVQLQAREENDQLVCVLPPINKGGVVWLE